MIDSGENPATVLDAAQNMKVFLDIRPNLRARTMLGDHSEADLAVVKSNPHDFAE